MYATPGPALPTMHATAAARHESTAMLVVLLSKGKKERRHSSVSLSSVLSKSHVACHQMVTPSQQAQREASKMCVCVCKGWGGRPHRKM